MFSQSLFEQPEFSQSFFEQLAVSWFSGRAIRWDLRYRLGKVLVEYEEVVLGEWPKIKLLYIWSLCFHVLLLTTKRILVQSLLREIKKYITTINDCEWPTLIRLWIRTRTEYRDRELPGEAQRCPVLMSLQKIQCALYFLRYSH